MGTKAFVEGMKKGYAWDIAGRSSALPDKGGQIVVHEFDYKAVNEVVYQGNGVTIRSWPAIHLLDGPVTFSLEWNGLKYVFGGDSYPNKWYIKHAVGADIASHEAFLPPKALEIFRLGPETSDVCFDENPHRAASVRQGDVGCQAAPGRWLPFGAIAREQRRHHG